MRFNKQKIEQIEKDVTELNNAVTEYINNECENLEQLANESGVTSHSVYKVKKYKEPGFIPFQYLIKLGKKIFGSNDNE